jgi:pyridoxal 5'-phosphate synthase pdxS subunit
VRRRCRKRARAIAKAAKHLNDSKVLLEVREDLQGAMKGLAVAGMDEAQMLQTRRWWDPSRTSPAQYRTRP